MIQQKIDGLIFKEMVLAAANILEKNKKIVDSLNVFPVPDGDTGTNMSLTMQAAVKEVKNVNSDSVAVIADALARGSLKGARGNSGVILSQLFRGFAKGIKDYREVDGQRFVSGMQMGVETAYKAVMKPTEGTILTVARMSTEAALLQAKKDPDILSVMDTFIGTGDSALKMTPDMLPVLKQAGVVDAGGKGLLFIYSGFKTALSGEYQWNASDNEAEIEQSKEDLPHLQDLGDIQFGYCTEFFIQNLHPAVSSLEVDKFRDKLKKIGDSLIVVGDEDLIKIHVHTNNPGKVLQYALRLGELSKIKIDNMREQHRHILHEESIVTNPVPEKEYGIVSVAMGEGITRIFKDLMVDQIIQGGQTMNPSIEDILMAIEKVPSNNVFILPNNSNIILAAEQAKMLTKKNIAVIPSKSIPQGLSAVLSFNPDADFEENRSKMTESINRVKTGQVTYAVRSSTFDGSSIQKGDIIGIADGKIAAVGSNAVDVSVELLKNLVHDDDEIITIFYGQDTREEDAEILSSKIHELFPHCDIEIHSGGQPLYYYIFSVE